MADERYVNPCQVYDITRLPTRCSCHKLVDRKVNNMKHITKFSIFDGRKEPEIAIGHPFKLRLSFGTNDLGTIHARFTTEPVDLIVHLFQEPGILFSRLGDARFTVVENVYVVRVASTGAIQEAARRQQNFPGHGLPAMTLSTSDWILEIGKGQPFKLLGQPSCSEIAFDP